MNLEQIIGLLLALLIMGVGVAGALLPALPSTPIVWAGAILHRLYFGDASTSWTVLIIISIVMLFSLMIDFLASMLGAQKLGATRRGILGALIGGVIGVFFSVPGLLLGPFLGALVFEWSGGMALGDSARAGLGALLGLLAGTLGKLACCLAMIGLFMFSVIWNSL